MPILFGVTPSQGDAGLRMCMLCRNLYSRASGVTEEDGTEMLTCSIVRECELDFATDDEIRGSVRRLAAMKGQVSSEEFKLREKAIGFTHKPRSILNDPSLDAILQPASAYCHDWMHAVLVNGVFNTIVYLLFEALSVAGFKQIWEFVGQYVSEWQWPGVVASAKALAECFEHKRRKSSRKAKAFKASASDGLCLYPVMALFVQRVLLKNGTASKCYPQCVAFLALCDVLDMLLAVPLGVVTPQMLSGATDTFLQACVTSKWSDYMHSKFHWLVHMGRHLEKFRALYTCFVHERKHKVAKRYGNHIQNTRNFEHSVLGEVLSHHLAELRSSESLKIGECALQTPKPAKPKLVSFLAETLGPEVDVNAGNTYCSIAARILPAGLCWRRDVVLVKSAERAGAMVAAEVWLHTSVDDVCMTLVNKLSPLAGPGEQRWDSSQHSPILVATEDILATCVHTALVAGNIRIVVPWRLRTWPVAGN